MATTITSTKTPPLLTLSNEVLQNIFGNVNAKDLAALSESCSPLKSFVQYNWLLCRQIYSKTWAPVTPKETKSWERDLHNATRLERILSQRGPFDEVTCSKHQEDIPFVLETIEYLLSARPSAPNVKWLQTIHASEAFQHLLYSSSLFDSTKVCMAPSASPATRQQIAKLHCLLGVIGPRILPAGFRRALASTSRTKVYDLREYTDSNLWGPFQHDRSGRVDWERVEALNCCMNSNVRCRQTRFHLMSNHGGPWCGLEACDTWDLDEAMSHPHGLLKNPELDNDRQRALDAQDPYGVTGTWLRIVCFLNHPDFMSFNLALQRELRNPRRPVEGKEAVLLIRIKIKVTEILPPHQGCPSDRPRVLYAGTSSLISHDHGDHVDHIRGEVQTNVDGDVRWSSISILQGFERWRSEGVQIGDAKSRRGVVGTWFDKDYEPEGPVGPTCFWKISNRFTDTLPIGSAGAGVPFANVDLDDEDYGTDESYSVSTGSEGESDSDDQDEDFVDEQSGDDAPDGIMETGP